MTNGDKRETILDKSKSMLEAQQQKTAFAEQCLIHSMDISEIKTNMKEMKVDTKDIKTAILGDGKIPGIVTNVAVLKQRVDSHDTRFTLVWGLITANTLLIIGMAYQIISKAIGG